MPIEAHTRNNMNTPATIIVHLPRDCENVRVVKRFPIGEEYIIIEICDDNNDIDQVNEYLFCCYQDRVQTFINPLDYAYIESTSTHHTLWHPIDSSKQVLDIYTKSMTLLYEKLRNAGLKQFWRIHSSYIINSRCVMKFTANKFYLRSQFRPIPVGEKYIREIRNKIIGL